jgi:hypothetical protein
MSKISAQDLSTSTLGSLRAINSNGRGAFVDLNGVRWVIIVMFLLVCLVTVLVGF